MTKGPRSMPALIPPMEVAAGTGQAPVGPDWVVELAWTGHRCIAYVEPGGRTQLLSSRNVSMTPAYPELLPDLERQSPPRGMILDGTLVARGEEHAPRAARLQRRSALFRPTERQIRTMPVDLQVADLLWLDGHSLVDLPYRDRRALLEGLGLAAAPIWTTTPLPISELPTLLRIAEAKGVEALHARHLASRYRPGERSPLWVRVPVPRIGRVLVGGWSPVDSHQPDRIASLLVGVPDDVGLRYVGRVGVGGEHIPRSELQRLSRADSPFTGRVPAAVARDAIWVEPRVAGLVDFTGFTADGRLRLPHWRGPGSAGSDAIRWARRDDPPTAVDSPANAENGHASSSAADAVVTEVDLPAPTPAPPITVDTRPLVFLCHASEDKDQVRDLYRRLTADGVRCWLDEEDILPGQQWEEEINKAIRTSRYVVACLSRLSTTKAGHVQKELRLALEEAKRQPPGVAFIIPLRFETCDIPAVIEDLQYADYFNPTGYGRLMKTLRL